MRARNTRPIYIQADLFVSSYKLFYTGTNVSSLAKIFYGTVCKVTFSYYFSLPGSRVLLTHHTNFYNNVLFIKCLPSKQFDANGRKNFAKLNEIDVQTWSRCTSLEQIGISRCLTVLRSSWSKKDSHSDTLSRTHAVQQSCDDQYKTSLPRGIPFVKLPRPETWSGMLWRTIDFRKTIHVINITVHIRPNFCVGNKHGRVTQNPFMFANHEVR